MLVSQNILILRCHRQTVSYDGFGRKIRVDYAQGPASVIGGDLPADGDYEVTLSRVYAGAHVFCDGRLEYSGFPGGYFDASGSPRYYITDWQGNNAAVVDKAGNVVQKTTYYPYGEPTIEPEGQRYLFGGKEREHAGGRNSYDFGARSLTPYARWSTPDPLADKFYPISPYSYCGGDPINFFDPNGEEKRCLDNDFFLHTASFGIKDDGTKIHIVTHGSNKSMNYTIDNRMDRKITSTDEFVEAVNENFTSIEDLRNEVGVEIVLHSCWTGYTNKKGTKPIAQRLSSELPNTFITAPSGIIGLEFVTGNEKIYRKNAYGEKVFSSDARWRTFFRGHEISPISVSYFKLLLKLQQIGIFSKALEYIIYLSLSGGSHSDFDQSTDMMD